MEAVGWARRTMGCGRAGVAIRFGHTQMVESYGMKKTFNIDEELFRAAKTACGAATDTATIRMGLEALVRRAAYERVRGLRGSETVVVDVPRRRERPVGKRKAQ